MALTAGPIDSPDEGWARGGISPTECTMPFHNFALDTGSFVASSDQLKALIKSHISRDDGQFLSVAMQVDRKSVV